MVTLTRQQIPGDFLHLAHKVNKLHILCDDFDSLLARPRLAIVGSRKVSHYGRGVTEALSSALAGKGVVIVSGLALGTDSIAHTACLRAHGQTIAVLPSGLDKIYPNTHTNLANDIVKHGGALVTEFEPGTIPYPSNFLERNRIIAALSDGVLVTEAAARSGSLNTANHALQLGKPVFAVPGNITNPLSAGCNNLIKAGAVPVTSPQDILTALKWLDLDAEPKIVKGSTPQEQTIIDFIQAGVSDGSVLLSKSGLAIDAFNQALTMLEITATIRPLGANHWAIA